jgi:hypothetical protein
MVGTFLTAASPLFNPSLTPTYSAGSPLLSS